MLAPVTSPALDYATAERHSTALTLLSNPARLRVLVAMYRYPNSTVGQLAEDTDLEPNRVSSLLAPMRDARLVGFHLTGRSVNYWICDPLTELVVSACLSDPSRSES